jgi:hypothetical protein
MALNVLSKNEHNYDVNQSGLEFRLPYIDLELFYFKIIELGSHLQ